SDAGVDGDRLGGLGAHRGRGRRPRRRHSALNPRHGVGRRAVRAYKPSSSQSERSVPRLFSAYVIVDWSAASKPAQGADSIWIGVLKRDVRFRMAFEAFNPPTRAEAETKLNAILDDLKKRSERALVGFDFPLGFPRGFATALKLPGEQPWRAAWDQVAKMVTDKPTNLNNRFGVASEINRRLTGGPFPFWGCPPKDALTTLQPKRSRPHGPDDLAEFRHADLAAKGAASIWKLYYNGSVGGQSILGI